MYAKGLRDLLDTRQTRRMMPVNQSAEVTAAHATSLGKILNGQVFCRKQRFYICGEVVHNVGFLHGFYLASTFKIQNEQRLFKIARLVIQRPEALLLTATVARISIGRVELPLRLRNMLLKHARLPIPPDRECFFYQSFLYSNPYCREQTDVLLKCASPSGRGDHYTRLFQWFCLAGFS